MQIPLKIYTFDDSSMQHILQIRVFFESSHRFVDVSLYELTGQESISFKHTIHLFQPKKKKKSKNTENYSSKVTRKITRDHSKLHDTSHANKKKGRNVKEGGKKERKKKKINDSCEKPFEIEAGPRVARRVSRLTILLAHRNRW